MRYLVAFLCIVGLGRQCAADIIINITEAAGGLSHITASGSATIVSQGQSGAVPGLFLDDRLSNVVFVHYGTAPQGTYNLLSGTGTINGESIVGTGHYSAEFSIRTAGLLSISSGTTYSFAADFISEQPFSTFHPGTYSGNSVPAFAFDSPIILNVNAVPEPSTSILLAGSVLVGVLKYRRSNRRRTIRTISEAATRPFANLG